MKILNIIKVLPIQMYLWNMYSSFTDSLIVEILLAITNKTLININLYILQYTSTYISISYVPKEKKLLVHRKCLLSTLVVC